VPKLGPLMRMQAVAAALLADLPPAAARRLAGGPVALDGQELDPGIALALRLARLRGSGSFIDPEATDPVPERRRMRRDAALAQGAPTTVGGVRELAVPGPHGPIGARHYAPAETGAASAGATGGGAGAGGERRPLLLYAHGGGWVTGDLDTHDELCRLICRHARMHVLALDYALAPEHPFPAGLEDVVAGIGWALREADGLGADPARVAVGGDSAGGNLVTVACQALAREGAALPALQVLIYPAVDRASTRRSEELFAEGFFLDRRSREWCEARYPGEGVLDEDPRISPLRGELRGLPAAIVLTAAFDPLRDEGEEYAAALRSAGVRVVQHRAPGMVHGFANMTGVSRAARDQVLILIGMIAASMARA
jgi:acetyl esterase